MGLWNYCLFEAITNVIICLFVHLLGKKYTKIDLRVYSKK